MRKTLQQWCEAEKMIAMRVGDVNCGEVLAARDDPVQQSLRLLDREKASTNLPPTSALPCRLADHE
jgi:hypothetical protein